MRFLVIRRGGDLLPCPRVVSEHETREQAEDAAGIFRWTTSDEIPVTVKTRTTDEEVRASRDARRFAPSDPAYRWDPSLTDEMPNECEPATVAGERNGGTHANS